MTNENIPSDEQADFLCLYEEGQRGKSKVGLTPRVGSSGVRPPAKPPILPFPFEASNKFQPSTAVTTATIKTVELPPAIPDVASTPKVLNPWIISVSQQANQSAIAKACRDATLAARTQQLTQILGENSNSPCNLPTPPERDASDSLQLSPDWPDNLTNKIKAVINTNCETPSPPDFSFEFTEEGKAHNLATLKKYNFDLGKALDRQQCSSFG